MRVFGIALCIGILSGIACEKTKDFGSFCALTPEIIESCKNPTDTGTKLTCIYETHPSCDHEICMVWQNLLPKGRQNDEPGFCTMTCDPNQPNACPKNATCEKYDPKETYYCIPDATYFTGDEAGEPVEGEGEDS